MHAAEINASQFKPKKEFINRNWHTLLIKGKS